MLKCLFVCVVLVASVFGTAATPCNTWIATAPSPDPSGFGYGHNKNATVYVDSTNGNDGYTGSSLTISAGNVGPLQTIEQVRDCYSHNTTMHLAAGTYRVPPMANMSKIPPGEPLAAEQYPPYFKVIGDSQATTTINVTFGDFSDLHIVDSASTSEVLYVYEAIFDFVNITADIQSSPSDPHSTLYWVHDSSDALSHLGFDNVKFIGNSANFPKHLIVHTGGNLVLKTVVIAPTNNVLPCNIIYWFGSSTGAIHKGQWELNNVTVKSNGITSNMMSYTYGDSLFEVDDLFSGNCNLSISVVKSTFENITWDNSAPLRRQSNADPIGLVFTLKNTNNEKVTITDSSFIRLNLNLKPNAAPVAVVSLTTAITDPLVFDSVTFSNNVGNSGGAGAIASIDGSTSVKIKGNSRFEGNKVGSTENDFGTAGGVFDLSEETIGGVGGPDVIINRPDVPDGLKGWVVAIIIAVVAVVVVAIVVIIIAAVYFRKRKYSQLTDDMGDFSESSSGSFRNSDKDNEMDSV